MRGRAATAKASKGMAICEVGVLLVGLLVLPATAAAQEPDNEIVALAEGIAPDSVELVDRIVAIVGDSSILYSEVREAIVQAQAQGLEVPEPGSAAYDSLARETLNNLVDTRILLQKAKEAAIQIPPEQLDGETNRRFTEIRNSFPSASAFREAVTRSGRSLVQYRQWLRAQVQSQMMVEQFVRQSRENLPPVSITDEEVEAFFEENLARQTRPATISFTQVVIEPEPGEAAIDSAYALAEQVLQEIRDGKDFDVAARQYSMDLSNRDQGGDLGWVQRSLLVPAFAEAAWAARTGRPIGPVRTRFGLHIIQVDNVRGGERKIRHILIQPVIDEADFRRTGELAIAIADSIRGGADVNTLAERYGVREVPVRFPDVPLEQITEFGPAYAEALQDPVPGTVVGPFQTEGFLPGRPVFAVVHVTAYQSEGSWELDDVRERVRENLLYEKGYRKFLEEIRNEVYVEIMF